MKGKSAVVVMTARGPDRILNEGGSQAWVLNPVNARKHEYLVAVQNRHNGAWGGATEEHGTAFLIGRISDVVAVPEETSADGRPRYMIQISEYALIAEPIGWEGRNPVRYKTLEDLGIDVEGVPFLPVPSIEDEPMGEELPASSTPAEVIQQFKQRLAPMLGVATDRIEVTIRA